MAIIVLFGRKYATVLKVALPKNWTRLVWCLTPLSRRVTFVRMTAAIPRFNLVAGKLVRAGSREAVAPPSRNYRTPEDSGKRVLVKRRGMYHLVDPETRCATISMGHKEAKSLLGKLRSEVFHHQIHTAIGTL